MNDKLCNRCKERKQMVKGFCIRCYYATRRNGLTNQEKRKQRNFLEKGLGIITDKVGNRWIIDKDEFDKCKNHFFTGFKGYAKSNKIGYLHKFICPQWKVVDHINRNPYDCRKINLRNGGNGINGLNKGKVKSASRFKGVSRMRRFWQARVNYKKRRIFLGTFETEIEAGKAIWQYAIKNNLTEFYVKP